MTTGWATHERVLSQKDHGRVEEALDTSLAKLGVDYVDLYLMHWPMAFDEAGSRAATHARGPSLTSPLPDREHTATRRVTHRR